MCARFPLVPVARYPNGMSESVRRTGSRILVVAWVLASALIVFTSENLWLDRLARSRFDRLPSLVPAEGSAGWDLARESYRRE